MASLITTVCSLFFQNSDPPSPHWTKFRNVRNWEHFVGGRPPQIDIWKRHICIFALRGPNIVLFSLPHWCQKSCFHYKKHVWIKKKAKFSILSRVLFEAYYNSYIFKKSRPLLGFQNSQIEIGNLRLFSTTPPLGIYFKKLECVSVCLCVCLSVHKKLFESAG